MSMLPDCTDVFNLTYRICRAKVVVLLASCPLLLCGCDVTGTPGAGSHLDGQRPSGTGTPGTGSHTEGQKALDRSLEIQYFGGYDPAIQHETVVDLVYDGSVLGHSFYWPPGGQVRDRIDMAEFMREPEKYPSVSIVKKGTHFRVDHARKITTTEYTALRVTAVMTSGPLAGSQFDIIHISNHHYSKELDLMVPEPSKDVSVIAETEAPKAMASAPMSPMTPDKNLPGAKK
ncbi:MAG: hypothetical protein K8T91_24010 [Planctomycetes bacterium]|nr:hypothetical protein [Planctomycetota bacterium]